ncbi:unnamed protein product [Paramecium primaurelia]|uniref:Uncharacterized protein n=1 Tax=Paramecium primaurelia TaxID=5886 RepID=A0A8S1MKR6_PARPR|nr:unnamed protein product [Paramecium primaurelia]
MQMICKQKNNINYDDRTMICRNDFWKYFPLASFTKVLNNKN